MAPSVCRAILFCLCLVVQPVSHPVFSAAFARSQVSSKRDRLQSGHTRSLGKVVGQTGRTVAQLAEGVYTIVDGFAGGNATVIIGDREVFVVDSRSLPSAARQDIERIRRWTSKPVRYLLNTHWHYDHNCGNGVYADAFPGLGIIAHVETKKDMDLVNPGVMARMPEGIAATMTAYKQGKDVDGTPLSEEFKKRVPIELEVLARQQQDLKDVRYLSPGITFDHELNVDIGSREVQVRFVGRGNTSGDAIVYLPKEKILIAGDLLVHPIPFTYDGYPSEWTRTLQKLADFDATTIVPGHGPVLHDKAYLYLVRDLLKSVVDQMNAQIPRLGPGESLTLDQVKGAVDLSSFRQRFAGGHSDLEDVFNDMSQHLIKITFYEVAIR
jgi:cyclase